MESSKTSERIKEKEEEIKGVIQNEIDRMIGEFDTEGIVMILRDRLDIIFANIYLLGMKTGFKDAQNLIKGGMQESKRAFVQEGMSNGKD